MNSGTVSRVLPVVLTFGMLLHFSAGGEEHLEVPTPTAFGEYVSDRGSLHGDCGSDACSFGVVTWLEGFGFTVGG